MASEEYFFPLDASSWTSLRIGNVYDAKTAKGRDLVRPENSVFAIVAVTLSSVSPKSYFLIQRAKQAVKSTLSCRFAMILSDSNDLEKLCPSSRQYSSKYTDFNVSLMD